MINVILRTTEYGITTERITDYEFALAQLDAGYDRVSIVDPEWDTVLAETEHVTPNDPETFPELFAAASEYSNGIASADLDFDFGDDD